MRRRSLSPTLAAVLLLALASAPARAQVVHLNEGSINTSAVPGGSVGLITGEAVDQASGALYVTDLGHGAVDEFDAGGAYAGVQLAGSQTPQGSFAFDLFSGIAVDNSLGIGGGDVYVADTGNGVVDRFSSSGAYECQLSGAATPSASECDPAGSGLAGALEPAGLAVGPSGEVYVADDAHAAIDEFGSSGAYLGQIADPHLTNAMSSIALGAGGELYVTNFSDDVVKFDAHGSFLYVLDEHEDNAVSVDPKTGRIYVAASEDFTPGIAEYESSAQPSAPLAVFAHEHGLVALAAAGATGKVYASEFTFGEQGNIFVYGPAIVVPTVTVAAATNVGQTTATLNGHVDPDAPHGGGAVTECTQCARREED